MFHAPLTPFIFGEPLIAAGIIALFLRKRGSWAAALSTLVAALICYRAIKMALVGGRFEDATEWLRLGNFSLSLGVKYDDLAALMLVIVGIVGLCVHVFSLGYMSDDPAKARYFGGLSIFMFSMIGIVLADNLFMIFIFWELVGFSSWLLINHWHEKTSASDAAKKAFITNRVGDFGFLIGIIWCYWANHTVNLTELGHGHVFSTAIPLLLFCGAVGKSAQLPLQVWLPDAMEGPTPVSALIHAATMVAAGIYMLCRIQVLMVPDALTVIMWTGTATALYAACAAPSCRATSRRSWLTPHSLSSATWWRRLDWRSMHAIAAEPGGSVIRPLLAGALVTGASAAMFHLTTHAFFKALLFLGAGSVIHGCHHEQDIFKMGGLRTRMPLTFWTFTIGVAAIIGVPRPRGLLLEGRDSLSRVCQQQGGLRGARVHGRPDRALHDAPLEDHFLGHAPQRIRRACARGRTHPHAAAPRARRARGGCGLPQILPDSLLWRLPAAAGGGGFAARPLSSSPASCGDAFPGAGTALLFYRSAGDRRARGALARAVPAAGVQALVRRNLPVVHRQGAAAVCPAAELPRADLPRRLHRGAARPASSGCSGLARARCTWASSTSISTGSWPASPSSGCSPPVSSNLR